jgi:hypothetical protein
MRSRPRSGTTLRSPPTKARERAFARRRATRGPRSRIWKNANARLDAMKFFDGNADRPLVVRGFFELRKALDQDRLD